MPTICYQPGGGRVRVRAVPTICYQLGRGRVRARARVRVRLSRPYPSPSPDPNPTLYPWQRFADIDGVMHRDVHHHYVESKAVIYSQPAQGNHSCTIGLGMWPRVPCVLGSLRHDQTKPLPRRVS